jgi:hypothetical protein
MGVYLTLFLLLTTNFQGKHTGPTLPDTSVDRGQRLASWVLDQKDTEPTIESVGKGDRFMSSDSSEKNSGPTLPATSVKGIPEPLGRKARKRRDTLLQNPTTKNTHSTQAPMNKPPKPLSPRTLCQNRTWLCQNRTWLTQVVPSHQADSWTISNFSNQTTDSAQAPRKPSVQQNFLEETRRTYNETDCFERKVHNCSSVRLTSFFPRRGNNVTLSSTPRRQTLRTDMIISLQSQHPLLQLLDPNLFTQPSHPHNPFSLAPPTQTTNLPPMKTEVSRTLAQTSIQIDNFETVCPGSRYCVSGTCTRHQALRMVNGECIKNRI